MRRLAQKVGSEFLNFLKDGGELVFLFWDTLRCLPRYRLRWPLILQQIHSIGVQSQPVVLITGGFTGAVFAAQMQFQFVTLGMASAVGPVVSVAMCRELGPVLCGLMIAGRVGASITAELATMRITEQVDALRSLGVYPTEYLIVPRFLATLLAMPILTAMAILCGIAAGYFVAVPVLGVDGVYYWANTLTFTLGKDVWIGVIKAFFFGLIIVMVACHKGLTCDFGAEGVGRATTEAVVNSSLIILIANFFFSFLLNILFPVTS
jgi:phospholipid/cholesterol/gamma-HCH transport system permease protein